MLVTLASLWPNIGSEVMMFIIIMGEHIPGETGSEQLRAYNLICNLSTPRVELKISFKEVSD